MREERYHLALDAYDKNIVIPCFLRYSFHRVVCPLDRPVCRWRSALRSDHCACLYYLFALCRSTACCQF